MKILLSFALVFAFSVFGLGQTKPADNKEQKEKTVSTSVQILIIQSRKKVIEEKIKLLEAKYSPEYSELVSLRGQLEKVNKEINTLLISDPSVAPDLIVQSNLSESDLMKIIILQNQKIIELLEKLSNKK